MDIMLVADAAIMLVLELVELVAAVLMELVVVVVMLILVAEQHRVLEKELELELGVLELLSLDTQFKIMLEKDIHMMKQEMRLFLQRNMQVGL
jgi:hypothetical protein